MEDLKNSYLNEQGLRQERDALRAQVAELRKAAEHMRAKCESLKLPLAKNDFERGRNCGLELTIDALSLPSASELSAPPPRDLEADNSRLREVLRNLLNEFQYRVSGGCEDLVNCARAELEMSGGVR